MSKSIKEIAYVAGILEGEGTFCLNNNSPRLAIAMTDLDVVEHVRDIMDRTKIISSHSEGVSSDGYERKPRYTFTLIGNIAIQWMMTVYPLMGLRRKSKIRELIHHWKNHEKAKYRKNDDERTRIIRNMMKLGISQEQAEIKFLEILNSKS